uniref:Uncharacterized protein n=1 Tax=Anguilla anguilla TaxID=7936 RepID=A0A0E9SHB7_ANGAN
MCGHIRGLVLRSKGQMVF